MTKQQLEICKKNFYYFNYHIIGDNSLTVVHKSMLPLKVFFSDEHMSSVFKLYHLLKKEDIYLVEEQERGIGFSTFCIYISYYNCFSTEGNVLFVCDNKFIKDFAIKIVEFTTFLKPIAQIDCVYNEISRTINFSNGGRVNFHSDITYDFSNKSKIFELLLFDSASMKNFDKLVYTIEKLIDKKIAKKAIINFNIIPPLFHNTENELFLKTEFKDHLKFITIKKY